MDSSGAEQGLVKGFHEYGQNLRVQQKQECFLTSRTTISFSRKLCSVELIYCLPISSSRLNRRPRNPRNFLIPVPLPSPKTVAYVNIATELRLNKDICLLQVYTQFGRRGNHEHIICTEKFIQLKLSMCRSVREFPALRCCSDREQVPQKAYVCGDRFYVRNNFNILSTPLFFLSSFPPSSTLICFFPSGTVSVSAIH